MFFGKLINIKVGCHSQKNFGWTQRRGTEKWVLQSFIISSCCIIVANWSEKVNCRKSNYGSYRGKGTDAACNSGRRCFTNILILLNVFLKIKLSPDSWNRAGKGHACPVSQSAPSLLTENSATFPLLQFWMIPSQPNPSSQGDKQSPFLSSAAIYIFEAQACPASATAREGARVHAGFEVCRGITVMWTSALHTPHTQTRQDSPASKAQDIMLGSKHQPRFFWGARSSWSMTLMTNDRQDVISSVVMEQLCQTPWAMGHSMDQQDWCCHSPCPAWQLGAAVQEQTSLQET